MGYLENLINDVEKTHTNLGNLVAMCQVIAKARKMMLIVSPSGCGKSTAMQFIFENTANAWKPDRLSISAIGSQVDKLTSFRSVIICDDFATTSSDYARKVTMTLLSSLVYTHRVESVMFGSEYVIEDFRGSAIIGIQPILLRNLMLLDEWDASIQDKALRYYHLYRPLNPNLSLPQVKLEKGIDIESVKDFIPSENKLWKKLVDLGDSQWSRARVKEHLIDLLKAIASLEQRKEVENSDYELLLNLLKPMAIEHIIIEKEQLEGERYLDNNLLALLTEYYSYNGKFSLAQISLDFKLKLTQTYDIMKKQNGNWQQISKSPTVFIPSDKLTIMLKKLSLEARGEK